MSARQWTPFLLPVAALAWPAHAADYLSVAQAQVLLFPGAKTLVDQPLKFDDAQRDRIKAVSGLRQRFSHLNLIFSSQRTLDQKNIFSRVFY